MRGNSGVDSASGLLGRDLERLTQKIFDISGEGIVVTDPDGSIVAYNKAFGATSGRGHNELVGHALKELFAPRQGKDESSEIWARLVADGHWEGEIWLRDKSGEVHAQWATMSIIGEDGADDSYVAIFTENARDGGRAKRDANYDGLTDLPGRNLFIDRLSQSVATAKRTKGRIALLFINLDGFKLINETLGHTSGDLVLRETAARLMDCVRDNDTVARFGGDEFTILLIDPEKAMSTTIVAQRVIDALNQPFRIDDEEVFLSGSIGITLFPDDAEEAGALLKNADAAMTRAKSEGQANYKFFTDDMNAEAGERLNLKNALAKAMEGNEFELYYQPKLDLASGRITGAEALMRWNSKSLGWVPPGRFIPVLEDAGLIREVGSWVLETACRDQAALAAEGYEDLRIAINLSPRQLHHPKIIDQVDATMKVAGIGADAIELEITESMLMTDPERTRDILYAFRDMGIHLAMDDFGTGYSSLNYLKRFPIDTIKIDRSFINDITVDPDDAEIVKAIINMSRALGRVIVAEGVETEEQLERLADYRCDIIQGYLISPPVPLDKFKGLLVDYADGRPAKAAKAGG